MAAGFLLPSMFVQNHDDVEDIGSDLSLMFNCTAGACTFVLILVVACKQLPIEYVLPSAKICPYLNCLRTDYRVSYLHITGVHVLQIC
jgi:hypothetical protein